MASYDKIASGSATPSKTVNFGINVANNNDRVLVIVVFDESSPYNISSIKVNSNNVTHAVTTSGAYNWKTHIYYFVNPPVGSNSIDVSFGNSAYFWVDCISLYDVDQTSPLGNISSSNTQYDLSLTPTYSGSIIVGASSPGRSSSATGSNQTQLTNWDFSACSYTPTNTTAGNSVTFSYSHTGVDSDSPQSSMVEFKSPSLGPVNLKSYNTNLKANIKTINTNPIANVKSLNTNV